MKSIKEEREILEVNWEKENFKPKSSKRFLLKMKTEDWLKEADVIVIECQEDEISEFTLVHVMPFNTKTQELLINHRKEMLLKEALKIKKRQIAKGDNLINYLKRRIGKKMFD